MYLFMHHVPKVLVPAQHLDETSFKEIIEGVQPFDECTSVRIDTNYREYSQLITKHHDLFLVNTFAFSIALSCLVLAIWPRSAS